VVRLYLTIAITFLGGLALFLWALFAWKGVGFVIGAENTADGRIGGFFILLLTIGLGFMFLGLSLFIHRGEPVKDRLSPVEDESDDNYPYKPFEKVWQNATIGCFFGALIAVFVYRLFGLDLHWLRQIEHLIAVAFGLSVASFGLLGIYTGRVSHEDGTYSRSNNPFVYWVMVAASLIVGIGAILFGIDAIGP
jgi:hypothetical protein